LNSRSTQLGVVSSALGLRYVKVVQQYSYRNQITSICHIEREIILIDLNAFVILYIVSSNKLQRSIGVRENLWCDIINTTRIENGL